MARRACGWGMSAAWSTADTAGVEEVLLRLIRSGLRGAPGASVVGMGVEGVVCMLLVVAYAEGCCFMLVRRC